ncbi:hypothetical protein O181_014500 [Austropuccinia psidii MF-1]|uniref:Uncharacterized protein n=1 Tax=Austropuccinia psidii MF-1 TaxID=1389203 RepID=A0A9Q3C129_9BASI|nr:hypothetical protein [Austropuccinia psidii MF-1]
MYDLKPFELSFITFLVSLEHDRRQNNTSIVLLTDKHKQKESQNQNNQKDEASKRNKQRNNKSKKNGFSNKDLNNSPQYNPLDSNQRVENLENLINGISSTLKISSLNVADTPLVNNTPASDSDVFMINCFHSLGEQTQGNNIIHLYSGSRRKVVKDLSLLIKSVRVNKKRNTFSLPATFPHYIKLVFEGIHINPVYCVPKEPVNLLSVSQLCDNGLNVFTKPNMMLVK